MKLARMPNGTPEIFHTIQGEGRNTGLPSVFIRASLCNLHCIWCDTAYTWNWADTEFPHEKSTKYRRNEMIMTLPEEEVAEIASAFKCDNFVFTGGEPLLQEKSWVKIMNLLPSQSHFEIETNGTLLPGEAFVSRIDQINVSPKLANSGVREALRWKPQVLRKLMETNKVDFKFVVHTEADFAEVAKIVFEAEVPPNRVFLMPKASSPAELEQNQAVVANRARDMGYRYSDRLHLRLFGAKRAV